MFRRLSRPTHSTTKPATGAVHGPRARLGTDAPTKRRRAGDSPGLTSSLALTLLPWLLAARRPTRPRLDSLLQVTAVPIAGCSR
jgi:hypothetical protein